MRSWLLFKSKNLEIALHPFFLLFVFLWLLAGLPLESFLLFLLVLGHELAHLLAAKLYGIKIKKIELLPFGGVGYLSQPLETNPRAEFFVAVAGPAFNLVVALFMWNYGAGTYFAFAGDSLPSFLLRANIFLFFFNLLPGLPLDGGRMLRASLSPRLGFFGATEKAALCGKVLGIFFASLGIALSYYDYMQLTLSLMGLFLYYAAGREQQSTVYVFLRYLLRKEKMLRKARVLKSEQLVALENTTVLEVLKQFKPARYHQVIVLNRSMRVLELLSESQILGAALQKGMDIPLQKLLQK